MTNLRPVGDKVLIQPIRTKVHKAGTIVTPEDRTPRPAVGFVVALGRDAEKETKLTSGDRVLLNQMAGEPVYDGVYWIYRACEILGVA